jgi:hypothetical protein
MSALTQNVTFSYIEEVVEGAIPTNPTFQQLPITSVEIEEVFLSGDQYYLNDRTINGMVLTESIVDGFLGFQLSYDAWKPFLIEVLRNDGSTYQDFYFNTTMMRCVAPNRFQATGSLNFTDRGMKVGQYINVSGFTGSSNNGIFKIISLPSDFEMYVVGNNDLTLEGTGNLIVVTVLSYTDNKQTGKTYTFRKYSEVNEVPFYEYFTGCKIDKIYLNFRLGEIISGLLFVKGIDRTAGQVSGESVLAVASHSLMSHIDVGHIYLGSSIDPARVFTELNIELDNMCKPRKQLASISPESILDGIFRIALSGQVYFEDLDVYNKWIDQTEMDFGLEMSDGTNSIAIAMNRCRLRSITKPVPGKNAFLLERFMISSLLDANGHSIYFNFH